MKYNYIKSVLVIALLITANLCFSQCPTIVWADEFSTNSLDLTKWSYQNGDGCAEGICGWGNNELQTYQEGNVTVNSGQLHIEPKKERVRGSQYTSGRIRSINKGDWTYGRFEAKIKLPAGAGLWPAFWMLSTNEAYGGWPQSGEIDIMEFVAAQPDRVLGTIHYGDLYPNNQFQGKDFVLNSGSFTEAFHEYVIEWEAGEIRWFVDDILYQTKTVADISPYNWPFDQDFYFLLNVAVGGNLGGPVDNSLFPTSMDVDYVRVYDGFKPYANGNRIVLNQAGGEAYSLGNVSNGTSVNWTVPSDAIIVSGQGTRDIIVDFGNNSGDITASFSTGCGTQQIAINVEVEPPYIKEFAFENFDNPAIVTVKSVTGNLSEVGNPSASGVNTSALSGRYVRNSAEQYDLLAYNVSAITDAGIYASKGKKFYMDVYTAAPIGTEIILQLESANATPTNYPTGRHSRYLGITNTTNQWQRIMFSLLDRPDPSTADNAVNTMIVLFNSNTFTGDTYYFDNFDSYQIDSGSPQNAAPTIAITAPSEGASFSSGSIVTISANASDIDGSVSQVEFFVNGNSIGTDASSPYSSNFTINSGSYVLSAIATDNDGATTTSTNVNISGVQIGTATEVHVSSIITGTASAGQGNKRGTAQVTIVDDLGQPIANATVAGTFSGTFNETASAVTNSSGVALLQTNGTAKGTVTVDLCVNNVTNTSLPYNPLSNNITCTGAAARTSGSDLLIQSETNTISSEITVYPNPVSDRLYLQIGVDKTTTLLIRVIDMLGQEESVQHVNIETAGNHVVTIDAQQLSSGLHFIELSEGDNITRFRIMKSKE